MTPRRENVSVIPAGSVANATYPATRTTGVKTAKKHVAVTTDSATGSTATVIATLGPKGSIATKTATNSTMGQTALTLVIPASLAAIRKQDDAMHVIKLACRAIVKMMDFVTWRVESVYVHLGIRESVVNWLVLRGYMEWTVS